MGNDNFFPSRLTPLPQLEGPVRQTEKSTRSLFPFSWVLTALHFGPTLFLFWAQERDWSAKSGISELLLMEGASSSRESKGRRCSWRWISFIPFPGSGQDNISVIDMTLWIMEHGSRGLEHLFNMKNCWGQSPDSSSASLYYHQEPWVPGDWGKDRKTDSLAGGREFKMWSA